MKHSITFNCPGCNARIRAPFQIRGKSRHCPGCGEEFVVPVVRPRDEELILVPHDPPTLRPVHVRY